MLDATPSTERVKLLFAGPVGAGKTTAIRMLSAGTAVSTEAPMSRGATDAKTTTTVGLDYSVMHVDDGIVVHLYGVPGQERFDFMRSIVVQGALGVILLLDATSARLGEECVEWIASLTAIDSELQFVIGISKTDRVPDFSLAEVRAILRAQGVRIPVMSVDPRDPRQCDQLVRALLLTLQS